MGNPLTPAPPPGNDVGMVQGPLGPDVTLTQWHAQQQQRYNQVTGLANLLNWADTSGRLPQDVADIAGGQYLRFLGEKDPFKALPKYTQWLQETIQAHGIGSNARQGQQAPGIVQPGPQPPPGSPPGAPQALAAPTQFSQSQAGTGPAALPATPNGQIGPTQLPLQSQPQTTVTGPPQQQTTVAPSVQPPPGSNLPAVPATQGLGIGRETEAAYQANLASAIALAQAKAQAAGRQQEIADRARMVESDPNLKNLADYQKASIIYGQFMQLPFRSFGGDTMTGDQLLAAGITTDAMGSPVNKTSFYKTPMGPNGILAYPTVPTSSTTFTTDVQDASSPTGFSKQVTPRSGGAPTASAPNIVPSMVPRQTKTNIPVNIGGSTVMVPKTTETRPMLGGAVPPPPGSAPQAQPQTKGAGGAGATPGLTHTLTPEQQMTVGQRMTSLQSALSVFGTIRQNIGLLDSMVDAGKISMAISPNTGELLISRAMGLTPQEEKLAAAFQQGAEHINLLRGPMAATGFRGPEAFGAMQSMKGQLMAKPEITKQVLDNTIRILQGLYNVDKKTLDTGHITSKDIEAPPGSTQLIYARDPSGKLHSAPAGSKLPVGWKADRGPATQ